MVQHGERERNINLDRMERATCTKHEATQRERERKQQNKEIGDCLIVRVFFMLCIVSHFINFVEWYWVLNAIRIVQIAHCGRAAEYPLCLRTNLKIYEKGDFVFIFVHFFSLSSLVSGSMN